MVAGFGQKIWISEASVHDIKTVADTGPKPMGKSHYQKEFQFKSNNNNDKTKNTTQENTGHQFEIS